MERREVIQMHVVAQVLERRAGEIREQAMAWLAGEVLFEEKKAEAAMFYPSSSIADSNVQQQLEKLDVLQDGLREAVDVLQHFDLINLLLEADTSRAG